ncbi:hypothetical protein J6590_070593 [Homalodisca vitripennis]|nr:hypothetical protein J6590_070593 [Homalodisca vitripennis]
MAAVYPETLQCHRMLELQCIVVERQLRYAADKPGEDTFSTHGCVLGLLSRPFEDLPTCCHFHLVRRHFSACPHAVPATMTGPHRANREPNRAIAVREQPPRPIHVRPVRCLGLVCCYYLLFVLLNSCAR